MHTSANLFAKAITNWPLFLKDFFFRNYVSSVIISYAINAKCIATAKHVRDFQQFVLTLTTTHTLVLPETSLFSGQWVTQLPGCALKRPLLPLKSEQDGCSIDEICKLNIAQDTC